MQLQALAETCLSDGGVYPVAIAEEIAWETLWTGILHDLSERVDANRIARRFHNTLVKVVVQNAFSIAENRSLETIVLSGGVMQNRLLFSAIEKRLQDRGLKVLAPVDYPANDGTTSLGQATITAARMNLH